MAVEVFSRSVDAPHVKDAEPADRGADCGVLRTVFARPLRGADHCANACANQGVTCALRELGARRAIAAAITAARLARTQSERARKRGAKKVQTHPYTPYM